MRAPRFVVFGPWQVMLGIAVGVWAVRLLAWLTVVLTVLLWRATVLLAKATVLAVELTMLGIGWCAGRLRERREGGVR